MDAALKVIHNDPLLVCVNTMDIIITWTVQQTDNSSPLSPQRTFLDQWRTESRLGVEGMFTLAYVYFICATQSIILRQPFVIMIS